jgi:hypothetical protein
MYFTRANEARRLAISLIAPDNLDNSAQNEGSRAGREPTRLDDGISIFSQRRWLWRDPPDCRLETLPTSPPTDRSGLTRDLPKGGQAVGGGFSANCGALEF